MTNTQKFAKQELDILAATVKNAIVTPYANEILALAEKFGSSGQSGGSAPMTASAISKAVKSLLLQQPICPVTGHESEWMDMSNISGGEKIWQNKRCGGLFKYEDNTCHYVDAIVWKGEEKWDAFTGRVYFGDELISSKQQVKFPFSPKTFYIDVVRIPVDKKIAEKENMHYIEDGDKNCYISKVKDEKQLEAVFKYYVK